MSAAAAQPPGYDAVHETISTLAAFGTPHRWIMTVGLAGLGVAHLVTAAGLTPLPRRRRALLALGGAATVGVAVFAQPRHGSSAVHLTFATIGFVALALWPATTATRDRAAARPIRVAVALSASAVSAGLLVWLGVTLGAGPLGVSERVLTLEQALWPLVVVVALRRATGHDLANGTGRMTP